MKKAFKRFFFCEIDNEKLWNIRLKAQSRYRILRHIYGNYYYRIIRKYNSFFPLSVKVDGMPVFPHGPIGIFISGEAKIGKDCVIFHQVTIGSNTLQDSKGQGAPIIGDNVFIGAGAKIIGNVTIGNNARIGANCVVAKDVPENTTVVCASPRYISKNTTMNNKFVTIKSWKEKS